MPVLADAYVFRAFLSKNSSSCKLVQIICLPIISSKSDFNRCRDFRVIKATMQGTREYMNLAIYVMLVEKKA